MKKWLSMFLAAVMLCGVLAGCGGTQSGSTPASGAQSASAAGDSNVNAEGFPIVNEPITLRGMVALNANVKDWNEHPALKRMEEAELVTSVWDTPEEGSAKRLFSLTDKGRRCLRRWIDALACYELTLEELRGLAAGALGIDLPDAPLCSH